MSEVAERIEKLAADLGLSMSAEFVPWSQSRNKGEKTPSLNWIITLSRDGRPFLTTDYMAGCAHCPSYKPSWAGRRADGRDDVIKWECEHGKAGRYSDNLGSVFPRRNAPIMPELADVLSSLVLDASVLDAGGFEDWARELGYDTDSRKAEAIYRACLDIALKLRNALGEGHLATLRDACQDY